MNDEVLKSLIARYREDLEQTATETETGLAKVKQQLTYLERNKIMVAAQQALLTTLEKDYSTAIAALNKPAEQEIKYAESN